MAMRMVIIGRDGVINHYQGTTITTPQSFEPIPGSLEAIAQLNHLGIKVAVATNQPGISAGVLNLEKLNSVHARLHQLLGRAGGHVDAIFVCPHSAAEGCQCRKPRNGLLVSAAHRFGLPLQGVPVIGRNARDREAAVSVKALPITVGTEGRFRDLKHAVEHLLEEGSDR